MQYRINNWSSYQSYKDRRPPWIRFHRAILDNFEYHGMSANARALLPMLWLLASEDDDPVSGMIRISHERIAFRLRMTVKLLTDGLKECAEAGFIECLQQCNESVTPSLHGRNEIVTPENRDRGREQRQRTETDRASDFDAFWQIYPRHDCSKSEAEKSYTSATKKGTDHGRIIDGVRAFSEYVGRTGMERRYIPHASTWLNQRRWEADYSASADRPSKSAWKAEGERLIAKYLAEGQSETSDGTGHGMRTPEAVRQDGGGA